MSSVHEFRSPAGATFSSKEKTTFNFGVPKYESDPGEQVLMLRYDWWYGEEAIYGKSRQDTGQVKPFTFVEMNAQYIFMTASI